MFKLKTLKQTFDKNSPKEIISINYKSAGKADGTKDAIYVWSGKKLPPPLITMQPSSKTNGTDIRIRISVPPNLPSNARVYFVYDYSYNSLTNPSITNGIAVSSYVEIQCTKSQNPYVKAVTVCSGYANSDYANHFGTNK